MVRHPPCLALGRLRVAISSKPQISSHPSRRLSASDAVACELATFGTRLDLYAGHPPRSSDTGDHSADHFPPLHHSAKMGFPRSERKGGAYTMGLVDKIKGLLGQATEKTPPLLRLRKRPNHHPSRPRARRPPRNSPMPSERPRRRSLLLPTRNMWPGRRRCQMPSERPTRSLLQRMRISRPSTYRPLVRKESVHAKRSWTHKPGLGGPSPTEAWRTKSLTREPK